MNGSRSLFKIVKGQTVVFGVLLGLRAAAAVYYMFGMRVPVSLIAGLIFGSLMAWLCSDIRSSAGMVAMSFMVSLVVTDVPALIITLISGGVWHPLLFALWMDGAFAAVVLLLLMIYGFINERTVVRHELAVHTLKLKKEYRIAFISDIHYASVQPEEILDETVERINAEEPDMVLIAGDIADERTPGDRLPELFVKLGRLRSRYGTFFVHGEHDCQEDLYEEERTYTDAEFDALMERAGIKCIDDELWVCNGEFALQGRLDSSYEERMSVDEVAAGIDKDKFTVVLEHQPSECEELAQAGVDLCLAGHFHGAQNWTLNIVYRLAKLYFDGLYDVCGMPLYVNAGLAGSKQPVRTHSHCEYLIIKVGQSSRSFDPKTQKWDKASGALSQKGEAWIILNPCSARK